MTADFALKLAYATAHVLGNNNQKTTVVIGKDTRLSGYMLEQALTAGFVAAGVDVLLLGPIPTPAVAHLTTKLNADFGVVISASHNPYEDNGIKLIGPKGYKLSDDLEAQIETAIDNEPQRAHGQNLGKARRIDDALAQYEHFLFAGVPNDAPRLDGMTIVLDCANGAAYRAGPHLFGQLGASVIRMFNEPDGMNINRGCGATHTDKLCKRVVAEKAHLGAAFDGDADRVILVDETGTPIDGDQIMAVLADDLQAGEPVISTVMANLGLERYLKSKGRELIRTAVGDRYVVEEMRDRDSALGGEPSGHIIFGGATCGDGVRTAMHMALHLQNEGGVASETLRRFKPLPQILKNVRAPRALMDVIEPMVDEASKTLGNDGRLLVRASGTEPLIRVMAEGDDAQKIENVVDDLCTKITDLAKAKVA